LQFDGSAKGIDFARITENFRLARERGTPRLNLALLRQAWELTKPFWTRRGAWPGYIIVILYTASTFCASLFSAVTARYAGEQLNSLSKHDAATFYKVILASLGVQIASSLFNLLFGLPYNLLLKRWQLWLTKRFIAEYLHEASHYVLNRERTIDNPDERIAADVQQFLYLPSIAFFGLVRAMSNLVVFGVVLWHFAWYLVPVCAGYYVVTSLIQLVFSKPIMILGYTQRRLEGDFRFALVNVRTNSESIAFLKGETVEQRELDRRQELVIDNAIKQVWWNSALSFFFTFTYGLEILVPNLLIAPLVLRGALSLGAFPQAQNAWSQLGSAFGFVGEQSFMFAFMGAMAARLHGLRDACVGKERERIDGESRIQVIASDHLAAENFTLETPKGERVLVSDLSFDLGPQGRLLVTGINGIGKSSLLRGFAGLWTRGSGTLRLPPREKMMFLPQRPYMSLGSLREQVTYPDTEERFSDDAVREAMRRVNVGHLEQRVGGLGVVLDWKNVLSPGEQQRLAFARALLRKPELMILDEATSALDIAGERLLYELLREMGCSYVSVAHRVTLYESHDTMLEMTGGGGWNLKPIERGLNPGKGDGKAVIEPPDLPGILNLRPGEGMAD
jgi:putative ATP-binding cassette transporter